MKSSCISHPEREALVMIRKWQIEACDRDICAAALLSFFEYWHNWKLDSFEQKRLKAKPGDPLPDPRTELQQFHTEDDLEIGLLGMYKRKTIRAAIVKLVEKGFVSIHRNPNPKFKFDNTRRFLFHEGAVKSWLSQRKPIDDRDIIETKPRKVKKDDREVNLPDDEVKMPEQYQRLHSEITFKDPNQEGMCFRENTALSAFSKLEDQKTDRSQQPVSNSSLATVLEKPETSRAKVEAIGSGEKYSAAPRRQKPRKRTPAEIVYRYDEQGWLRLPDGGDLRFPRTLAIGRLQRIVGLDVLGEADRGFSFCYDEDGEWLRSDDGSPILDAFNSDEAPEREAMENFGMQLRPLMEYAIKFCSVTQDDLNGWLEELYEDSIEWCRNPDHQKLARSKSWLDLFYENDRELLGLS